MEFDSLKPLIAWLHLHPQWGGVFAFFIAFTESIAIIGLIVPGVVVLSLIGVLIGTGVLPFTSTFIWTLAGAFAGDMVSYGLGFYYQDSIRKIWPLRLIPQWFAKGEELFKKHGGKTIIFGRFIGPIRPVLPLVAAILKMPLWRFMGIDLIAVFLWTPTYLVPGILIGTASLSLSPEITSRIVIFSFLFFSALWLSYWILKQFVLRTMQLLNHGVKKLWYGMQRTKIWAPLCKTIQMKNNPLDHSQLSIFLLFLLALACFVILTLIVNQSHSLLPINIATYHFLHTLFNPLLEKIMIGITLLGDKYLLGIVLIGVFACLAWQRNNIAAWHWLALGLLVIGIGGVLQRAIISPRPPGLFQHINSSSFPSGHVAIAICLFGFGAILLARGQTYLRRYYISLSVITIVLAIAISRLYLNVHWVTDVLGGILLGTSVLLAITLSYRRFPPQPIQVRSLLLITGTLLVLVWGLVMMFEFKNLVRYYTPHQTIQTISSTKWWQSGLEELEVNNRFGNPIETVNIESIAPLELLEKALISKGWSKERRSTFIKILELVGSKQTQIPSSYDGFYEDKLPVIVMVKKLKNSEDLLVIRFWNSYAYLHEHINQPIWVGTLQKMNSKHWTKSQDPTLLKLLEPDLVGFSWKTVDGGEASGKNILIKPEHY